MPRSESTASISAAAGVDLIVTQLSQHEHGVPELSRQIMIPPQWMDGPGARSGKQ